MEIGATAAAAKGQALVMERLHRPEPEIQEILLALLEAMLSKPQGEWEMTEVVHRQIRTVLGRVLMPEDWKVIAESARDHIYFHVLKQELVAVESP